MPRSVIIPTHAAWSHGYRKPGGGGGGDGEHEPAGKHEVRDLNVKLVIGDKFSLTEKHRQNHTHTEGVDTYLGLSFCRPLLNNP